MKPGNRTGTRNRERAAGHRKGHSTGTHSCAQPHTTRGMPLTGHNSKLPVRPGGTGGVASRRHRSVGHRGTRGHWGAEHRSTSGCCHLPKPPSRALTINSHRRPTNRLQFCHPKRFGCPSPQKQCLSPTNDTTGPHRCPEAGRTCRYGLA